MIVVQLHAFIFIYSYFIKSDLLEEGKKCINLIKLTELQFMKDEFIIGKLYLNKAVMKCIAQQRPVCCGKKTQCGSLPSKVE